MMPRAFRTAIVALTGVAALLASAPATQAFSLFGLTLFEDQAQQDAEAVIANPVDYQVDLTVTGARDVEGTVRGASQLVAGQDKPASGAAGLLATARGDYQSIVAALYGAGYYGPTVLITVDGREATSLPPDANLGGKAQVAIRVNTGPLFHFGKIAIANQAPRSQEFGDMTDLPSSVGLAPGEVAESGAVARGARLAVDAWRELGYPLAKVGSQDIVADHRTNLVDVRLNIDPGPHASIGAVTVQGAKDVNPEFIARQTGLMPGAEYDPDDIRRGRERLAALGVFSVIKLQEADSVGPDGTLPITIVVAERKPRRIGLGASYSTTEGIGLESFFLHRNLFGEAENLRLDARLGGVSYPVQTKDFDYYFGATFTKPGVIFNPDTKLVSSVVAQKQVLKRYTETSIEGRVGLDQEFTPELSATYGLSAKQAQFVDPVFGTRDFTILGAYGTLSYDTRDDPKDATEGFLATVSAEPFYETTYGTTSLLATTEGRAYLSLAGNDRVVLAGRVKVGALFGPSVSQIPPDKLFFAGGGGSVRGYPYRSIGVVRADGTVTGGKFLTEASAEARVKVTDDIGVVAFVDAGYVTDESFVGLQEGTQLGAGLGLRYYTGLGPLRLDVALPLNKRPGDPNYALYVGIGQAF